MDCYLKFDKYAVVIEGDTNGVSKIEFVKKALHDKIPECLETVYRELLEYFQGKRKEFTFKLNYQATDFQRKVYQALREIPYGEVASYKDIAIKIDNPKACRAVGNANNKNKIPIVYPCHRVVGSNGKLVGFAGGLDLKDYLINLEKNNK